MTGMYPQNFHAVKPQGIRMIWRSSGKYSRKWTRSVASRANFELIPLGTMQPGDNNDFIAHVHSVQGLSVRRKHLDNGIRCALETLSRRFFASP